MVAERRCWQSCRMGYVTLAQAFLPMPIPSQFKKKNVSMGKSNMKCTYQKTIFLPFSKVRTKQYFRRKVIWFNENHFFKLSYSFQVHWLLWICVVLMRFVKGDHDDSSQKSGKEARGLLVDSLGASACDIQTLFRPYFVIYLFLLYKTPH